MSERSGSGSNSGGDSESVGFSSRASARKSPEAVSPVAVGELVADKYRVEQIVAAGGMGVVIAARHEALGQRYAIKFLLANADPGHIGRFQREARAAARIQSSHVCRVFDCGALPSGVPYLVMEYLTGRELSHELKARKALPVTEAVDLLIQALDGIAEAHALGIVHRDLKPSNLFLCERVGRPPEVKVLDFGISKVSRESEADVEEDLTNTQVMLGSPRYMSPEQVRDAKHVDTRTDVWSLGVILYQMLVGKPPFTGATMGEVLEKVLAAPVPRVRQARPDVPEALSAVIECCLNRDREARYRDAAQLALALAPFASANGRSHIERISMRSGGGVPLAIAPIPRAAGDEPSLGTVGAFTGSADFRPRRTRLVLAVLFVFASLLAAAYFVFARHPLRPAAEAAAPVASAPIVTTASAPIEPEKPVPQTSAVAVEAPPASASATPPPKPAKTKPAAGGRGKRPNQDLLDESY